MPQPLLDDPRRKQLIDAMAASIKPPDHEAGHSNPGTAPALPTISENISVPNLPDRPYEGQQPSPRLGVSLKGLTGVDRSLADLAVRREAASEFPTSEVKQGEILPPKMHKGFWDHLKSAGRTAVLGMGDVARRNPNASTGELLGAGATGGVIGGVSPLTGDALFRRAQLGQAESDIGRELGLEQESAQLAGMKAKPGLEAERIRNEADARRVQGEIQRETEAGRTSRSDAQQKLEELKRVETERHNRESERLSGERNQRTGQKAETPKADFDQRASWYFKKQREAEDAAKDLRAQAANQDNKTEAGQTARDDLLKRAGESEKNALEYRDRGDLAATEPGAKQTAPSLPTPDRPETRKGKISKAGQQKWLADNPGKTIEDMKRIYPNAVMQ